MTPTAITSVATVLLLLAVVLSAFDLGLLTVLPRYAEWTLRHRIDRALTLGLAQSGLLALLGFGVSADSGTATVVITVVVGYVLFGLWPVLSGGLRWALRRRGGTSL